MDNNLINMSDGVKDGFVLFYVKDGEVYPVILTDEQIHLVDLVIGGALGSTNDKVRILNQPQGKIERMVKDES